MAPRVGFEPTIQRLTAACLAVRPPGNKKKEECFSCSGISLIIRLQTFILLPSFWTLSNRYAATLWRGEWIRTIISRLMRTLSYQYSTPRHNVVIRLFLWDGYNLKNPASIWNPVVSLKRKEYRIRFLNYAGWATRWLPLLDSNEY